ncbi:unnamed protein product [Tilletia controversa]|nr:unnamed protein product [Tilletia caries]CAD6900250.1 unnamed protein product [Tilletia controversa]CAD6948149.1 unnamed protein product [Tilletia laevis]CAD6909520.1 unnamed protein product [Tilletia controversa]CAD6938423.1 unnamed protein product [Tilletia caries]
MTSPFPPSGSPTGRPESGRSNANSSTALRRRVHEGVPVDVEGSDDEFGGDDYARSLRSSSLHSLADVPTTASSSSHHSHSAASANDDDAERFGRAGNHPGPQHLQFDADRRFVRTEVTAVREPGTPSSVVPVSPSTIHTPTLAPPASYVSPLLHVLTTPLNPTFKPGHAGGSAPNAPVAYPPSSAIRKPNDTARSASVSSSSGSLYGRSNGGSGMGSVGGAGPSRSTSIDGSAGPCSNTGFPSGKSNSVDNFQNSVPSSPMSFTRRQSSGISQNRSAPPIPLDLKPSSRSLSSRAMGSDSVENLHDGALPGRFQNSREKPISNGMDNRMEPDMVPQSPGASSARSSSSRFLSVGRKWPGYLHGNSSNESATSALQTRSPVGTGNGILRTSVSSSIQDAQSGHYPGILSNSISGASRPSTAGSAPIDASNFPRPSALNGASWAGALGNLGTLSTPGTPGTRSPERSSFITNWEKTSQRPSTVTPDMAPRVLTEDDIEYEEATHWGEPTSLFAIRRRLVASVPDLGVKTSTFSRSRAKTMDIHSLPQSSLLAEKDYRKLEEKLEQREKDLSVEVLAEQETATVTLVVFTEQREAKWITKGPASPHALAMEQLPSMNDPWGVRIDAKGIVARKKLKSNIELVSTRTILRCPECTAVRQTRMDVQCQLCRGIQAVEMVYVVLVTVRMANFTPLKLPAAMLSGTKQPHFHYYEGDPVMRGAALQERSVESALTAAKRVGQQHYGQYGAKLLMVKARVDRRRITSVAVHSAKTGKRRTFDLQDGHDGKIVETTPGRRSDDASASSSQGRLSSQSTADDGLSAGGSRSDHSSARGLGRKHSMPAVLKSGSSLFSRRNSTDDSGMTTTAASEKSKVRKKFFG